MKENIVKIQKASDNKTIEITNDNKTFYLKKDIEKLLYSNNGKDYKQTFYTLNYFIQCDTKIKIL